MNPSFWKSRRVLVTGHTGFKGSWLSYWLSLMGAEVCGYALAPHTDPALFEIAELSGLMDSRLADIRDSDVLAKTIREFKPEIVIHMAAQALVRPSYENPVETYDVNVMGTARLLDVLRKQDGVRATVVVTSDKCYENREWDWPYRESDAMGGFDPYSSSKGAVELLVSSFRRSFFNDKSGMLLASARAGNVIGGGDWSLDRLVPDLIRGFVNKSPVVIRNPAAIRPWQHVLEPLGGYLLLAEKLWEEGSAFAEGWNFGPEEADATSVGEVADGLVEIWGGDAAWTRDPGVQPHEAFTLRVDSSKARARLGWKARWRIQETLESIARWHRAYEADKSRAKTRDEMKNDIEMYGAGSKVRTGV